MPKFLTTADVLKIEPKNRPRFADGGMVREPQIETPKHEIKPEPQQSAEPKIVYVQPDVGGAQIVAAIKALGEQMPVAKPEPQQSAEPTRRVVETTFRVTKRDDDGKIKEFKILEVIEQ